MDIISVVRDPQNGGMSTKEVYDLVDSIRKEFRGDFKELDEKSDKIYVKIEAFDPVRRIVYGLVTIILTGVIVALIKLVFKA